MVARKRGVHSFRMLRRRAFAILGTCALAIAPMCARGDAGGRDARDEPPRTTVFSCVDALVATGAADASWHALPAPMDALDYKLYWNDLFQVFEIVFRNRAPARVEIAYATGSPAAPRDVRLRRRLGASESQRPPGETVLGAVAGARACVRARIER